MNEQDKKAFEKWFLEYPSWVITMSRQESCSKAWQAACEYKHKEIDELEKEQVRHIDILKDELNTIIKSLQAENAKLRECVEFYADLDNHKMIYDSGDGFVNTTEIDKDGGKRARKVLEELNKGETK